MAIYDRIGGGYATTRRADPRIGRHLTDALAGAGRVVNVGAGPGSYEPEGAGRVVAVEPSAVMRAQRRTGAAPCVEAVAADLPFADGSFDAAMAVLTVHHWPDPFAGLDELRRVARRQVILTFDPDAHLGLWLVHDYLPEMLELTGSNPPTSSAIADHLGGGSVGMVPIPADCLDGFLWAYWRRPSAYLDPAVQASISGIAQLPAALVAQRMARLAADLDSGRWLERNHDLLDRDEVDGGFRLVVCGD